MDKSGIQVLTKTELQEDWYTNKELDTPSTSGGLAINLDGNGKLAVSFLREKSVMTAHRKMDADGNSLRTWTVEDTLFPSSSTTPNFLDSILSPSNATYLAILGQDNNIYVLDCSAKFPCWEVCSNGTGLTPVKINIFTTTTNVLRIAVFMSDGTIQILDPSTKTWFADQATEYNAIPVYDYKVGSAFTQTSDLDNSIWGYVLSGGVWGKDMQAGVALIAADQNLPTTRTIYQGKYSSMSYVAIAGSMPRTTPLVFGIDESKKVTYFQAQEDGTFVAVLPFGTDLNFTYMDAIFRTGPDAFGNLIEWIDLYALDTSGNLWHTRNAEYDTGRVTAVKRLTTGDIVVPNWETPSIISSKPVTSFDLTMEVNGSGHAYVVTETASSLECLTQDMSSTNWTTSPIITAEHSAPTVVKRNVYFVELTVCKNGVVAPGLVAKISSLEYCQIDVNGVSTSVTAGQFYSTLTNARGLLCFTIPATESLSCPALSVWVEGMEANHTIDVQPTGKIQHRYSEITVDDLKEAKDQTDQSLVFGGLTDSQLKDLKESLNNIAATFKNSSDSQSPKSTSAQGYTNMKLDHQRYMHSKSSTYVSSTRNVFEAHKGLISHPTLGKPKPFRIRLGPTFSVEVLEHSSGLSHPVRAASTDNSIFSSWGDFWIQVSNGVVEITEMTFQAADRGVEAAIDCVIDGVSKVWNGTANFVSQAFDAIGNIFKRLKIKAVKVFNWLAYIFAWDDIKATAVAFRGIVDTQIVEAGSYLKDTIKTQLKTFFTDAKSWISDHKESAIKGAQGLPTVGNYDKPESDPTNDLPSSSSWLSNKVENSAPSSRLDRVATINDPLNSAFQTFMNNLNSVGISEDLSKAVEDASDFFHTLTSKDVIDKLTFDAFVNLFLSLAVLGLDLCEAVIDTFLDVLVSSLEIFKESLDTLIDIPIISKIFREVVGLDLTLFNLIAVPMAIPITILYKMIVGEAPFSEKSSSPKPSKHLIMNDAAGGQEANNLKTDIPLLLTGLFTIVYGVTDLALDSQPAVPYVSNPIEANYITWTNVISSWLILGTGVLSAPTNTRTTFARDVAIAAAVTTTMLPIFEWVNRKFCVLSVDVQKVHDVMGVLIPGFCGVAGFASGIWHIVNIGLGTETGTVKDWTVVIAELTGPIAGMAKFGKFSQNPEYLAILPVIDFCSHLIAVVTYVAAAVMGDESDSD